MKVRERFQVSHPCLFCGRPGTSFVLSVTVSALESQGLFDPTAMDWPAESVEACRDCLNDLKAVKT